MLRPSLQRDYTLITQHDDALDLPVVPRLADDASDEDKAAAKVIADDRAHKLKVARETGDWKQLIRPGAKPTEFICRQLPGTALDWWHDHNGGDMEKQALLLRLAIKSIKNLDFPEDIVQFETADGHRKLSADALDYLYSLGTEADPQLGRKIVGELAGLVFARAFRGLVPLSKGG